MDSIHHQLISIKCNGGVGWAILTELAAGSDTAQVFAASIQISDGALIPDGAN